MDNNFIISELKEKLSPRRYEHTLGVMHTAEKLARHYNADVDKCVTAAVLHDCAKDMENNKMIEICNNNGMEIDEFYSYTPDLLHSLAGTIVAKNIYGIHDEEILDSIKYHTTGRWNMSLTEQIVFIADFIEPGRTMPGVEEIRDMAFNGLDEALFVVVDRTIKHVIFKRALLHPDTIHCRNWILTKLIKRGI